MTNRSNPTSHRAGPPAWVAWLLIVVSAGASAGQTPPAAPAGEPERDARLVREVLAEHNKARAEEKLPPLELDPKLVAAAKAHAEDMAGHDKMTHEGSDGSTPSQRIERQGYHFRSSGENVAAGQTTAEAVMDSWMNSPKHRENILGKFTQVGIAVARDKEGKPFWAVDFGTPWPRLDPSKATSGLLDALNKEREKAGKPALKPSEPLNRVAIDQARALAREETLGAGQNRGNDLLTAVRESGYRYRKLAEVAASGQAEPADVVAALMKEEANRANLLGDFTEAGVGYATSPKGVPFWCLILARPARPN